jgi:hypothetical protein
VDKIEKLIESVQALIVGQNALIVGQNEANRTLIEELRNQYRIGLFLFFNIFLPLNYFSVPLELDLQSYETLTNRKEELSAMSELFSDADAFKVYFSSHRIEFMISPGDNGLPSSDLSQLLKIVPIRFIEDERGGLVLKLLLNFYLDQHFEFTAEDDVHFFTHTGIRSVVAAASTQLKVIRNKELGTSTGRADFSISTKQKQVFRGEDKMASRGDPKDDLTNKTLCREEWEEFYGTKVNFIFGYYSLAEGSSIDVTFVLIDKDGVVFDLAGPFNLNSKFGMLACRAFSLCLVPYLLALGDAISASKRLDWVYEAGANTPNRRKLYVSVDPMTHRPLVVKENTFSGCAQSAARHFNRLNDLKEKLEPHPHQNLLKILSVEKVDKYVIKSLYSPLGVPMTPDRHSSFDHIAILKDALKQVIEAMSHLHRLGFLHHDIRWPNVVQRGHFYVLVDYDFAREMVDGIAGPLKVVNIDSGSHWLNRLKKKHSVEVDYWGIGYLMRSFEGCERETAVALKELGRQFCEELETKFNDHPTASFDAADFQQVLKVLE